MSDGNSFREILVFDRELTNYGTPVDLATLNWSTDIGKNVGVSYEQQQWVTLRDCMLEPERFKPLNEFMRLYLRRVQFKTPELNIPTELTAAPSQQWHFNLVLAERRSFKKL
jgi:hypothetical protein